MTSLSTGLGALKAPSIIMIITRVCFIEGVPTKTVLLACVCSSDAGASKYVYRIGDGLKMFWIATELVSAKVIYD